MTGACGTSNYRLVKKRRIRTKAAYAKLLAEYLALSDLVNRYQRKYWELPGKHKIP